MTMFGSVRDLAALLGTSIADDDQRAIALLSQASAVVASYLGSAAALALPDTWTYDDPRDTVTVSLAARMWGSTPGVRQSSETVGPYTRQTTFAGDAGVDLTMTSGERALLDAVFGAKGAAKVRSINLVPGLARDLTCWPNASI